MSKTFPQCNFSLEFPAMHSQILMTQCTGEFQNDALWDTLQYAIPYRNLNYEA